MDELSIKVNIAGRIYPLTIKAEEEECIRKAAKEINEKIKEYQKMYAVRDKQDLLAMCALEYSTNANLNAIDKEISYELKEIQSMLNSVLKDC